MGNATNEKVRVLVVDDSAIYRLVVRKVLDKIDSCEFVGKAEDGESALNQISELKPDLITLDIEMPGISGIEVLREIQNRGHKSKVIVLSKHTAAGAQVSIDALMEGAMDVICKPSLKSPAENEQYLYQELAPRIDALRPQEKRLSKDSEFVPAKSSDWSCSLVLIGSSTGGPEVLRQILSEVPADFPLPIVIVQHIPSAFSASLAKRLDGICNLNVVEIASGMPLEFGHAYVAPGGRHTKLVPGQNRVLFELTDDPPENNCRPSVDYTLRSATELFSEQVLAVILTGMGRDGLKSCQELSVAGGRVIAQGADDCTVYGMPKAVIEAGLANRVSSIDQMVNSISNQLKNST